MIDFDRLYVTPDDERRVFVPHIERILRSFDIALPPAGALQEPVPSDDAPDTLLPALRGDSTARLFDLLFQWTD